MVRVVARWVVPFLLTPATVYYYCLQRCVRELKEITRHALQRACEKGRSAAACFQLELLSPTEMEKSGAHFFFDFSCRDVQRAGGERVCV